MKIVGERRYQGIPWSRPQFNEFKLFDGLGLISNQPQKVNKASQFFISSSTAAAADPELLLESTHRQVL